ISEARNSTMKMTNRICAICAAPAAMPPNPNMAAMIATMRNASAQPSMFHLLGYAVTSLPLIDSVPPHQPDQNQDGNWHPQYPQQQVSHGRLLCIVRSSADPAREL